MGSKPAACFAPFSACARYRYRMELHANSVASGEPSALVSFVPANGRSNKLWTKSPHHISHVRTIFARTRRPAKLSWRKRREKNKWFRTLAKSAPLVHLMEVICVQNNAERKKYNIYFCYYTYKSWKGKELQYEMERKSAPLCFLVYIRMPIRESILLNTTFTSSQITVGFCLLG